MPYWKTKRYMMNGKDKIMPLKPLISFDKLLRHYDALVDSDDELLATRAKEILKAQAPYPELRDGFQDVRLLETYKDIISLILQDSFSPILSTNEIKAASLPYYDIFFNSSQRFQKIINDAGPGFEPVLRNQEEGLDYIVGCIVILNFYYGFHLDFSRPFFYDIPDANGVMRHYRILYNADFLELIPTDKAKDLVQEDVDELLANLYDIDLWMEKIPPNSFQSKGFVISNMFDVTAEHSISEIKSELIASDKRGSENFMTDLQETFRSLFKLPNIKVGLVNYNARDDRFEPVYGKGISSFILNGQDAKVCNEALCQNSYSKLIQDNTYFTVADVSAYHEKSLLV